MKPVSYSEIEFIKTCSLSLKMKNNRKIIDYLKSRYEENPVDAEKAFNYAVCMSLFVFTDPNNADKSKHQFAANEAFGACLKQEPRWWLARYLRSEVNQEIPDGIVEMSKVMKSGAYVKTDPDEDRGILIGFQEKCEEMHSYFLCPYVSQAKALIFKGKVDEAAECCDTGFKKIPLKKSEYNIRFFTQPFYDVIVYFRKLDMMREALLVKEAGLTLFPQSKVLLMT
jgi:hypothetical protein